MTVIGEPLPGNVLAWFQREDVRHYHYRKCGSCGMTWATVEVPLYTAWDGKCVVYCPRHPKTKSRQILHSSPQIIDAGKRMARGPLRARSFGGVYRRRQCRLEECVESNSSMAQKAGKPIRTRWSTLEVLASGKVCNDVMECPRCPDGRGRALTDKKEKKRIAAALRLTGML